MSIAWRKAMPGIRKVVTRAPHRRVGTVGCPWFRDEPIEYESLLERDFIRIALLDLRITAISEQPFDVELGEHEKYTPDFLLTLDGQPVVVEVKPESRATSALTANRLESARKVLSSKGYRFFIATEKYIHREQRSARAGVILRHARSHLLSHITARVLDIASMHSNGIQIIKLAGLADVPETSILHLVGRRQLRISRSLCYDPTELVFPIGGDDGHLHP
jgi:hypothetical protein